MSKGTIALSILTAAVSAIFVVLLLRGLEERARVDLPHFRKREPGMNPAGRLLRGEPDR